MRGDRKIVAVTYNRCSTEEEVQVNALATQVTESREIAEAKGWIVVDQYVELKSGTSTNRRTEYQRLLEDMKDDRFDIIVIKSIDRLMRSTTHIEGRINAIGKEIRERQLVCKAETREMLNKIEHILVHTYSQLEIVFKDRIAMDINNEELFRIKVPYTCKKKYQIERERNTKRIYDLIRDNPNITIAAMGNLLDLKSSYVSASIKQLKEQGKVYYIIL